MALPAVLAWFGANGGVVHKHIQVAPMPGAGLGVRATDALPPGTVVVTVPEALFLWKRSAARKSLRPLLTLANLNRWVTLLLHVFYESTHPDGEWGPYFAAMPAQFDQPIFWVRGTAQRSCSDLRNAKTRSHGNAAANARCLVPPSPLPSIFRPFLASHHGSRTPCASTLWRARHCWSARARR